MAQKAWFAATLAVIVSGCGRGAPTPAASDGRWAAQLDVERHLAEADPRYAPTASADLVALHTTGSSARIGEQGARIEIAAGSFTLAAIEMGRESLATLEAAPAHIVGPSVEIERGSLIEWWRALPSGLEHGLTLRDRPQGDGELAIGLAIGGDVHAHARSTDEIELVDARGEVAAIYAHLVVLDADGTQLGARLGAENDRITITVDDHAARYPIIVDPLLVATVEYTITPATTASNGTGHAVALDGTGTFALVGFPGRIVNGLSPEAESGSAAIYRRNGTTWGVAPIANFDESDATGMPEPMALAHFGSALAISQDASLVAIGAPDDSAGAVYVFAASTPGTWLYSETLVSAIVPVNGRFGAAVALSIDGSRLVVGSPAAGAGIVEVYLRGGAGAYALEQRLVPSGAATAGDQIGAAVAISADGSRVIVGAPRHGSGVATVFSRAGTTWSIESTLVSSTPSASGMFGGSVAIAADGSRALVGATGETAGGQTGAGAAHAFVHGSTTWSEEQVLTSPSATVNGEFALSVSVSSDASRATLTDGSAGVRVFSRTGASWMVGASVAVTIAMGSAAATAISADGGHGVVGAAQGVTDRGQVVLFRVGAADPNGTACSGGTTCLSGFCADGVCCDSACGASSATDCMGCTMALTGAADGTCGALSATRAPMVTCTPAAGPCEPAVQCQPGSTSCPAQTFLPSGTICRPAAGPCDVPGHCTGSAASCPPNMIAAAGTVCSAASGCASPMTCDGVSTSCPAGSVLPAGTSCRAIAGPCDVAEVCNGSSATCPVDAFVAPGVVCHSATSVCESSASCTGASAACPMPVPSAGTTPCGPAPTGVCELAHHCSGIDATCITPYASGTVCRAAAGSCDVAEVCLGSSPDCPPDGLLASGVVCRASTAVCDPAESCDGSSTMCPGDVTMCMAMPDMGLHDAGGMIADAGSDAGHDASASTDGAARDAVTPTIDTGAAPPPMSGSCGCRAGGRNAPWLGVAFFALLWARRAARR